MVPRQPVASEFRQAARDLRALAAAATWFPEHQTPLAVPGSTAAADLDDHSLDDTWGRATHEVCWEVAPRMVAVADHVSALAALTLADHVTMSIASMVRPAVEGLGTLYWLYDPAVGTRERVRRRYNLRLRSQVELLNLARGAGVISDVGPAREVLRIRRSAERKGFEYQTAKGRGRHLQVRYLDVRTPSDQTLITGVLDDAMEMPEVGPLIHRITSAVVHAQGHGILPFILDHEASETPGVADAAVGIDLRWYALLVVLAFRWRGLVGVLWRSGQLAPTTRG